MNNTMKKIRDIATTVLLGIVLLFFIGIAILQLWEDDGIKDTDDRIVLGVGTTTSAAYGSALKGQPAPMGDCVGIVSGGSFTVIDKNAQILTSENFMLSDPILHSKGKYCVVADFGGKKVRLYEKGQVVCEVDAIGEVISVVTNANGFFAVATEETGYNAVINVYHKNGEPIYRYRISGNVFVDMDISANNRKLIAVEAQMGEGVVGSKVVMTEFNRVDAEKEFYVESNMYVNVHFNKNGSFVCLGNTGVDFYRADGAKVGEISFEGRSLEHADIATDDFVALAFAGSDDGSLGASTLEIYDKKGKLRGASVFAEKIQEICVNGSYVGVAHSDVLDIVKSNGKIKKTIKASSTVKNGIPFETGDAALVFAGGNTQVIK